MVEARRRVHERFGVDLEHEVQFLGPLELPGVGNTRSCGEVGRVAARRRTSARTAVLPARRGVLELRAVRALGPVDHRRGRAARARDRRLSSPRETRRCSRSGRSRSAAVRRSSGEGAAALRRRGGAEPAAGRRRRDRPAAASLSGLRSFTYDRAFPHTLRVVVRPERPVLVLRQGGDAYLVAARRSRAAPARASAPLEPAARLYVTKDVKIEVGTTPSARRCRPPQPRSRRRRGAALPGGVHFVDVGLADLTLRLGAAFELRLGDVVRPAAEGRDRTADPAPQRRRDDRDGYLDVSVPERPVLAPKLSSRRLRLTVRRSSVNTSR